MSAPTLMQSCAIRSASPGGQISPEVAAAHHVSADGTGSRPTQRRPGKSSRAHGSSAGAHASADGLPLTRCPGGKSQPLTDHRAHVSAQWSHEPGTRDRAWSASRKPAGRPQSRRSCQQPPPDIRTSKHLKADIRALTAAVLSCCTRSSGFRIISLTCGAMGIRTPDLLHAISRQVIHRSPPPQVSVLAGAQECALVRPGCGTSVLYQLRTAGRGHIRHGRDGTYLASHLPSGRRWNAGRCLGRTTEK